MRYALSVLMSLAVLMVLSACPTDPGGDDGDPTWELDVQPILSQYCGSCHEGGAGGSGGIGFVNSYEEVTTVAAQAECDGSERAECIPVRLLSGSMPLDGCSLDSSDTCISSAELDIIQEWLDAGLPE